MLSNNSLRIAIPLAVLIGAQTNLALGQNTSQLSENGWYADDTRADGLGGQALGTNLVSPTLTDNPEAGASGNAAHDVDITRQISFGTAPGSPPAGTHRGSVRLTIGTGATQAKSQLSARKDDGIGHATGLDAFGPGMSMQYSWLGTGTGSVTPSIKFGVQSVDYASIWFSSRTGENAWDKLMVYEPGLGNGQTADGLWHTEIVNYTTGKWWLFDRTQISGSSGTPLTFAEMSTSITLVGTQTIAEIYAKMIAPGALISSVQVGAGTAGGGADVYVNQLTTNFYRPGEVTTFGEATGSCDQDLVSNVIFGSGVANGSFTVDRNSGVELGLRGKLRFNAVNAEENTFNSNGDGTYIFETGYPTGVGLPGWAGPSTPFFAIEWSVNSDYDGTSLNNLDALTYEVGLDFDPGPGTAYLIFDPVAADSVVPFDPPVNAPFWNHSFGNNLTAPGGGSVAGDQGTYIGLLAANNLIQNSWSPETFNQAPFNNVDPLKPGVFDYYLAAFDGGTEVARTMITIVTKHPTAYDQNVTNNLIIGGGITNGSFVASTGEGIEIGLRGKTRFNAMDLPENIFNSNGDGTYTFEAGSPTAGAPWVAASTPFWNIEWSINTDVEGTTGDVIDDYTYEMGIDFDRRAGTNFLVFDPITSGAIIPFNAPQVITFWDHSFGTNGTPEGGGVQANDEATYIGLTAADNLIQNSWNMELFNEAPFSTFNPNLPGHYEFYLAAMKNGVEVARAEMTMVVMVGPSLALEAPVFQTDQDCNFPGTQIVVELSQRNLVGAATGFQAFLNFDSTKLTFEGASSSYTGAPYSTHIQAIATAEVAPGQLRLDGNVGFGGGTGSDLDFLLATLVFTAHEECTQVSVAFDLSQNFGSELSAQGSPIVTSLLDSSNIVPDATHPLLSDSPDILVTGDSSVNGGCNSAIVTYPLPTFFDACTDVVVECFPSSGTAFPAGETTKVTCVGTDEAGNFSTKTFDVTVTSTNLVMIDVQLVGVTTPVTRCIQFVTDSCGSIANVDLGFDGTGNFTGLIEVPCGTWTSLCAKDEQHSGWDNQPLALSLDGTFYMTAGQFLLPGGDTDNDADTDINDVTWYMFQFGGLAIDGGSPWDGSRDADFSNNGAVGSEDYTFLTSNWLSVSACACSLPFENGSGADGLGGTRRRTETPVRRAWQVKLDVDGNRRLDYRDVRAFELANGLPSTLSEAIRSDTPVGRR
ncbi:MAG: hypothetical protein ACI9F9_000030 [Candidatus Paceibacteria bacterium]|jgi:hypothetical protein